MRTADEYRVGLGESTVTGFSKAAIRQDIYRDIFLEEPEDPYGTVKVSPKERYASSHLRYKRLSDFMLYEISSKTGLSFTEFLELPTNIVEFILAQARQESQERRSTGKKAGNDLESVTKEVVNGFTNMKTHR